MPLIKHTPEDDELIRQAQTIAYSDLVFFYVSKNVARRVEKLVAELGAPVQVREVKHQTYDGTYHIKRNTWAVMRAMTEDENA